MSRHTVLGRVGDSVRPSLQHLSGPVRVLRMLGVVGVTRHFPNGSFPKTSLPGRRGVRVK